MELDTLYYRLKSLTVFRPLLSDPVLAEALELLRSLRKEKGKAALEHWAELVSLLQRAGALALGPWLWEALLALDNPWGRLAEEGRTDPALASAARRDYEALAALAGDFDAREALGGLCQSEEDVMSYICFPDQAKKFFEERKAKEENVAVYTIEEA